MESPPSVYFFPEFLRQGSALADFRNPSLAAL
jgi:UDP-glucose 6-dehydrogenase